MHSLRFAFRSLRRSPGFTIVAIVTLALAIASTTAVFSVVDAVVLRGLPYGDAGQLRSIYERSNDNQLRVPSFPTFRDWANAGAEARHAIDGLAFVRGDGLLVGSNPERTIGAYVTPGFFSLMRTPPFLGRTFLSEEERPGGPKVAVLSYDFFMKRFGGDRSILGKLVAFDSVPTTIIGVMPRGFAFPNFGAGGWLPPAAWQPIQVFAETHAALTRRELHVDSRAIVRLARGADSASASAAMGTIEHRLATEHPKEQAHWTSVVTRSLSQEMFGQLWSTLALVSGAIVLVLVLACANVANLLLIRSSIRGQEFALRSALGATRWRLARQPLIEAAIIALASGALGVFLAWSLVQFARPFAAQRLPFAEHIVLDPAALWFALGITAATPLLVGTLPAFQTSRANLVDRLRGGAASQNGRAELRVRNGLVSLQFALAITLLIGSGLLVQSVRRLTTVSLGYDPDGLVALAISPPKQRYDAPADAGALYARIMDALRTVPSVRNVAAAGGALLQTKVEVDGRSTSGAPVTALYHPISDQYLATLHVPIKQGRGFTEEDMKAPAGLLVADTLARQLWPAGDAVGRRITIYRQSQARADIGQPITLPVIGVVADYHEFGADTPAQPEVYLPYTLEVWPWMKFDVRAVRNPRVLADIEHAVHDIEPGITFFGKPSFDNAGRAPALSDPRMFVTSLLSAFALLALFLAAIGLYGVIAYATTQRTREIGIRLAIGATPGNIVRLLLRQATAFVVVGMVGGVLAAFAVTRLLMALLFETNPTDIATFIVVPLVLGVVAVAASAVPAWRAARTDPSLVTRVQ